MPSVVHNEAKRKILRGELALHTATIKVLLLDADYAPNPDTDFVSAINGDELNGTGYTPGFAGSGRKTLANQTVTRRDGEDRAVASADPLSWTGLDAGTAAFAVLYLPGTSDADSLIVASIDIPNTATIGTTLAVNWAAIADGGILAI